MSIFNLTTCRTIQFLSTFKKFENVLLSAVTIKTQSQCYGPNGQSGQIPKSGPWNVLFFGTNEFGAESLKALYNKYETQVVQRLEVVTLNTGREDAVIKYAKEKGIVINNWPLETNMSNFHIGIVVSFGRLIPTKIIKLFPLGMLNVHGSLLPKWRGAAPIIYSLINGDHQTGITIMKIKPKKFDTGEIVLQKQINISEHETLPELYTKLAKLGADALTEIFEDLSQALQFTKPQNEVDATYAPKITSSIALVKWDEMSAKIVYNLHRALLGLYPLSTKFQDKTVKLHDITIAEESITRKLDGEMPGTVIYDRISDALIIKCAGNSCISVKKLIIQGKSVMKARDFNNGFIAGKKESKIFFS